MKGQVNEKFTASKLLGALAPGRGLSRDANEFRAARANSSQKTRETVLPAAPSHFGDVNTDGLSVREPQGDFLLPGLCHSDSRACRGRQVPLLTLSRRSQDLLVMPHVVMPLQKMGHLPGPAPTSHLEGTIRRTPDEEVDPALAWGQVPLQERPWVSTARRRPFPHRGEQQHPQGAGLPENTHSQDTRGHSEGADKGLTSVRTHTCARTHMHTHGSPSSSSFSGHAPPGRAGREAKGPSGKRSRPHSRMQSP